MIGLETHTKEELIQMINKMQELTVKLAEKATNPPIMFQTNDKEYERRAEETISKLSMKATRLELEVQELEEIIILKLKGKK